MHVCKVLSVLFLILLLSVQFLRIRYFFNFDIDLDITFNQYCVWIVFMQACSIVVFLEGRGQTYPTAKKKRRGGGPSKFILFFYYANSRKICLILYAWCYHLLTQLKRKKDGYMPIIVVLQPKMMHCACVKHTRGFKGFFLSIDGFGGLIQYPLSVTLLCHFNTFEFLSGVRPHATLVPRI